MMHKQNSKPFPVTSQIKLIPVSMVRPNARFVYAPSKLRRPIFTDNLAGFSCKKIKVSFAKDGVSNYRMIIAYSRDILGWYIVDGER